MDQRNSNVILVDFCFLHTVIRKNIEGVGKLMKSDQLSKRYYISNCFLVLSIYSGRQVGEIRLPSLPTCMASRSFNLNPSRFF